MRDLLLSYRAQDRGYVRRDEVDRLLAAQTATGRFAPEVFCLLVVALWHQQFVDQVRTPTQRASA